MGALFACFFPAKDPGPNVSYTCVNTTQQAEDAYDLAAQRKIVLSKPIGTVATIAHLVKSALGSGILSGHVAYKKAGFMVGLPLNIALGIYMTFCLYILGYSSQVMCKRTGVPVLAYAKIGEAAMALSHKNGLRKCSRCFGYAIDIFIIAELYGACATYQIMISKTIKQLVEDTVTATIDPQIEGYPGLRVYMAAMLVPCILICLLRYLQWLAPFSIVANCLVALCCCVTIYYAAVENPKFENMVASTGITGVFQFIGMIVFSMSCASQIISVENNMADPSKYTLSLCTGMVFIVIMVTGSSFFGYAAYREKSDAPITVNYPMTTFPKVLKGCIGVMIYITHALNFWVPFTRMYSYVAKCHNPQRLVAWEYFYRALFVIIVGIVAIAFPDIGSMMGFLGCFCLSHLAFIFPNVIFLLVVWERPGFGACYWRLWRGVILILIGEGIMVCGSVINFKALVDTFAKLFSKK